MWEVAEKAYASRLEKERRYHYELECRSRRDTGTTGRWVVAVDGRSRRSDLPSEENSGASTLVTGNEPYKIVISSGAR